MPKTPNVAIGVERTVRTLLRSDNPAALEALIGAISSSVPTLRLGAIRALALREDSNGHRNLIERFDQLGKEEKAALVDVIGESPMTRTLANIIHKGSQKQALVATNLAVMGSVCSCLPELTERTQHAPPNLIAAFGQATLGLANVLNERIVDFDSGNAKQTSDPVFTRRAAINALNQAINRYEEHQCDYLIESLLLLAPFDESSLQKALRNPSHKAHEGLLKVLRRSSTRGVARILGQAFSDTETPQEVLEIAASRDEHKILPHLLASIEYPLNTRVRKNAERIEDFAWLSDENHKAVQRLSGRGKATAMALAARSKSRSKDIADLASYLLETETETAQLAAAESIPYITNRYQRELLEKAIASPYPKVAAKATHILGMQNCDSNKQSLIELLDHEEAAVREKAQESLPELSYSNFRDSFEDLAPEERRKAGELVRKGDPEALSRLDAELNAGPVSRRLKGLEMVDLMGLVDTMTPAIIKKLKDPDAGVRVEAVRLLGHAEQSQEVLQAVAEATQEESVAVQAAARDTATMLDAVAEVQRLVELLIIEEQL